ncbi:hypothetical protein EJB05_34053, partial [Eragrostis curvula]
MEKDRPVEKSWMPMYLRAYDAVDEIKASVEAACPGIVSCADILALAARDSTTISGGFSFPMPTGRRDALVSIVYDYTDLEHDVPSPYFKLQTLIDSFTSRGLGVDDLVALSGAHSFGRSQCFDVADRLYPSPAYPTTDQTMNATYADELKKVCPSRRSSYGAGDHIVLNNNRVTDPNVLSNQYYSNVLSGQVLFVSDQTLTSRNDTAAKVAFYAGNPLAWKVRFAAGLVKMGGLHVLTGTQGEIRKVCSAANNQPQ